MNIEPAHELVEANKFEHERLVARVLLESEARAGAPKRQFCIPWPRNLRLPRNFGHDKPYAAG